MGTIGVEQKEQLKKLNFPSVSVKNERLHGNGSSTKEVTHSRKNERSPSSGEGPDVASSLLVLGS